MKINHYLTAVAAALLLPGIAAAEPGRAYINPAVGAIDFDSDTELSTETLWQIGAEIGLTDQLGVEFKYNGASDATVRHTNNEVDFSSFGVDLIYYLGRFNGNWQPYLAGGVGHGELDPRGATGDEQTFGNVGFGVRYHLNESWSLRADARALNSFDNEETHGVYTLGLSYAWGGSEPAPAAAAPAPEPAPAAPVDSDGDGVPDDRDRCPDTPRNREVDEHGCEYVLQKTETIRMEVLFAFDSAEVRDQFMNEVEKVAKFLRRYGGTEARIEGHSDSVGTDAYNKRLSQERADAVRQVLVERFNIDPSRLTAVGYGEERPLESNDTDEGRRQNRRVVAVVNAEVEEPAMR